MLNPPYQSAPQLIEDNAIPGNFDKINPFSHHNDKISAPQIVKHVFGNQDQIASFSTIKLALISFEMTKLKQHSCYSYSRTSNDICIDDDSIERNLFYHLDESRHLDEYCKALDIAVLEHGANIVALNELGFPTSDQLPSSIANDHAVKLVQQKHCVIAAGSYHDSRTQFNSGHLYYFGDNQVNDVFYHKQVSAANLGELVSVPPDRHSIMVEAFGIRIAVVICLDMLDYSTMACLFDPAYYSNLILVPSFADNTTGMINAGKEFSEALPGIVAVLNKNTKNGEKYPGKILYFGREIVETSDANKIVANTQLTPNSTPSFVDISPPGGDTRIILFEIKMDEFLCEKHFYTSHYNPSFRWLFGIPTIRRKIRRG